MNENSTDEDQAMIDEALRRMKAKNPGIPGAKVQAFLQKLQAECDQADELTEQQIREKFQRFVAEASYVPG